ncbi:MAG TPA: SRPBCC family protein [Pirellulales bacterium]
MISFTPQPDGRTHRIESEQFVARPRDEVFPFFADAANLEALTPPFLGFQILTPAPIAMQAGALIDYRIRLHGVPITWRTEITVWEPPYRFVDEQRRGPYQLWRHEHLFEEVNGGTRIIDRVDYRVPGWFLAGLINRFYVQGDLQKIFAYRRTQIDALLGPNAAQSQPSH